MQLAKPAPEGAGQLPRRDEASIIDQRELQMRATDVPAERSRHGSI
jgi:hypothetical protein